MVKAAGTWAILVAGRQTEAPALTSLGDAMVEVRQLLARAAAVAPPLRTCAVIDDAHAREWQVLAQDIPPRNVFVQHSGVALTEAIGGALLAIRARDASANVILIPADHCAPESSWVASVSGALQLAFANLGTIYMLHDKPQNDPRSHGGRPGMCSSSVLVGFVDALLEICRGSRAATIVDLMVEDETAAAAVDAAPPGEATEPPLNVIHVSSVQEYARLQRGHYARPPSTRVNVHV